MTTAVNNTVAPAANISSSVDQLDHAVDASIGWLSSHSLQILLAGAMAAIIVLAMMGLKRLGLHLCDDRTNRTHWPFIIGKALARTRLWFMVAVAAQLVATYADAPLFLARTVTFLFTITMVLQVAIWARVLILGAIEHRAGVDTDASSGLGSAMGIIRLLVSVAVFAIALIVILDNLGVNVTGLVAGLGIGGIAIGLAAQGIFSDLFAALSILFDKPFRRGDGIKFDQTSGSVESIGLKSTRVRAVTGEQVVISNANLLNKELRNFDRLEHRRMVHRFGVIYQTMPDVLSGIPARLEKIVTAHRHCSFVRCGMVGFGASSLDFELQFDVHHMDYEKVFATNHEILIAILQHFNAEAIMFAYPTQTSFTAAPDGTMIMPYPEAGPETKPSEKRNGLGSRAG
ncbi:hypothetical protein ACFB49_03530 [Sphingomonas sp. DBB INV C78]|uniref:mechanosensitive ion channel family protein n=1 Tax=Sphingomonas sp. DBB INV C78 TaxID=3349434 RepID=UPI0036D2D57D